MSVQEQITVDKGKKKIVVINFGELPMFDAGRGDIIPHNFQAETFVSGKFFLASTFVTDKGVKYRFALKEDTSVCSGWKKSPTGALDEVNAILKNPRHKKGTNGQLMIGVTYPPVQARIREVFPSLAATDVIAPVSSKKRVRDTAKAKSKDSAKKAKIAATNSTSAGCTSMEYDHLIDERSMQPIMNNNGVSEPKATPCKRPREDSQQDLTMDELAASSQQSFDIAALDARALERQTDCPDKLSSKSREDSLLLISCALGFSKYRENSLVSLPSSFALCRSDTQNDQLLEGLSQLSQLWNFSQSQER